MRKLVGAKNANDLLSSVSLNALNDSNLKPIIVNFNNKSTQNTDLLSDNPGDFNLSPQTNEEILSAEQALKDASDAEVKASKKASDDANHKAL